ncbi:recombinase [Adhaeribacter arboris]|uniref:Recombinase n=1 Tax=Adhaeribacter arboris TaxID=2072846 RepID=A0A2T2YCM2_9BACT|nr:site-specific integrase [Adhaeribacter arboris]PSR53270.1 recombinase [Adhaeribacter arboris]
MKTTRTFSILAMVRRTKTNKLREVPVIMRLTIDGKISEIATKHYIKPELWDSNQGKVKGKSIYSKTINDTIELFKLRAKQHYNKLIEEGKDIDLDAIKNGILGIEEKQLTLLDVFTKLVKDVKAKIGVEFSFSCYNAYKASENHIRNFIYLEYKVKDFKLKELSYKFIADFELYLKTKGKCRQNGAIKHVQRLKKAIKIALKYNYLEKDPFLLHSMSKDKVVRLPLNEGELELLKNTRFNFQRLEIIKDMFLFTCYTGLAFIDAKHLRMSNLSIGIDGEEWIYTERKKTGNPCTIPLLSPAKAILEKYKEHERVITSGFLLPIPSNQKFNAYLKEIADICGIRKKLTVHIGRHTFATTIALQNGVPMEVLKQILGHDNINTTQIYAKVTNTLIAASTQALRKKLAK